MLLIYLIANYLYRKYGVPLNNFLENWTRGISHLKSHLINNVGQMRISGNEPS